jgi:1,4-dihydroxy-2-naphthoyl-CoA hydrolase
VLPLTTYQRPRAGSHCCKIVRFSRRELVLGDDLYPARSDMPGHFGIRIADADKDKLVGELDVDDRHLNNSGHVHGGALAAFADDLGGTLAGLNVPPGFRTTTIESKTNIFRACLPGRLTGVAVPFHVGRRMIVLQTSIYRPDGKLAAMMIQTQMVLPIGSATPADEGGGED